MLRRILLAAGCALAVGCGTVANQNGDVWYMTCATHPPSEPYGGVRQDLDYLASDHGWRVKDYPLGVPVFNSVVVCDLALSAAADTVMLPYDLWVTMMGRTDPANEPRKGD